VDVHGVKIIAPLNLPATVATHASMTYSRNLLNFMTTFWDKDTKRFNLDWADDILKGCAVTHEGQVVHAPTLKALNQTQGGKA
jgi:NAD(P) transhydrogenase subunit alpha